MLVRMSTYALASPRGSTSPHRNSHFAAPGSVHSRPLTVSKTRTQLHDATSDVMLLNTCSVRDAPEQKAVGKMQKRAKELRRSGLNVVLGFMGCMAKSRGKELIDRLPAVDLVVGTQRLHSAADYISELVS